MATQTPDGSPDGTCWINQYSIRRSCCELVFLMSFVPVPDDHNGSPIVATMRNGNDTLFTNRGGKIAGLVEHRLPGFYAGLEHSVMGVHPESPLVVSSTYSIPAPKHWQIPMKNIPKPGVSVVPPTSSWLANCVWPKTNRGAERIGGRPDADLKAEPNIVEGKNRCAGRRGSHVNRRPVVRSNREWHLGPLQPQLRPSLHDQRWVTGSPMHPGVIFRP